jgi:hypothetical protein
MVRVKYECGCQENAIMALLPMSLDAPEFIDVPVPLSRLLVSMPICRACGQTIREVFKEDEVKEPHTIAWRIRDAI